jgi:hypothetical protein
VLENQIGLGDKYHNAIRAEAERLRIQKAQNDADWAAWKAEDRIRRQIAERERQAREDARIAELRARRRVERRQERLEARQREAQRREEAGLFSPENLKIDSDSKIARTAAMRETEKTVTEDSPCAICLGGETQAAASLTCGHVFHEECLRRWLKRKMRCPLCNHSC